MFVYHYADDTVQFVAVGSRCVGFLRRSAFTAARVSDHRARHAVTVLTMSPNSSQQGDRGGGG